MTVITQIEIKNPCSVCALRKRDPDVTYVTNAPSEQIKTHAR